MTYAAVFTLAALASRYTLTEEEIATGLASITVQAVEEAIAAVVAARVSHAA